MLVVEFGCELNVDSVRLTWLIIEDVDWELVRSKIVCGVLGMDLERGEKGQKIGKKRGPKKCFRGRQVGAFSVF